MTILNFPAGPVDGAIYTVNGISYVYNNGAWSSNSAESNNSLYVNVDGDNMTGDLTLGTDKIVLDAGNGNINTEGSIFSGERDPSSPTASGTRIARDNRNGGVYVQSDIDSENLMAFQALAGTNEKFKVTYDGAVTAAGEITTGVGITFPDGSSQITAATSGGGGGDGEVGTLLEVCTKGNFTSTDISIGNSVVDPRILLQESDGSATFAGSISAAGKINSGEFTAASTTTAGVRIQDNGQVAIQKIATTDSNNRSYRNFLGDVETFAVQSGGDVLIGGDLESTTTPTPNISLNADGSITAAGSINASGRLVIEGSQAGASLAKIRNTAGSASSNGLNIETSSTGVLALDIGYNNGGGYNQTCTIQADGSITAASTINILTGFVEDKGGTFGQGYLYLRNDESPAVTAIGIMNGGSTSADYALQLLNDGSATFAAAIACERVYCMNGGAGDPQVVLQPNGIIRAANTTVQPLTSERRLKENIVSIDPSVAWQTIKNTPYYEYNFIDSDVTVYGPMADEVPSEMVVQPMEENEAGVMVARSDEEGPIRSFDNGMLQGRLFVALQTALKRIEALEAEVADLKS